MKLLLQETCIFKVYREKIVVLIISVLYISVELFGQPAHESENLFITAFTSENGLRQSMVSQVCQDEKGLIWMVTGDGLHYFDGEDFKAFRIPVGQTNNHTDNVMRFLVETEPGHLVLSSTSSLLDFNTSNGQFKTIYRKEGLFPIVFKTFIDKKPLAWIPGLNFCLVNNTKLENLELIFKNRQTLPAGFIPVKAVRTTSDELLICSESGILVIHLSSRISDSTFYADWFPVTDCKAVVKTVKGKTLVLAGSKLFLWKKNGQLSLYFDTKLKGVTDLFVDSREIIWLTDKYNNTLHRLSGVKLEEIKLHTRTGKYIEDIAPAVISIFEDRESNLWFGTDGNGVLLYSPDHVQFHKANIGFTRCLAAFNKNIWAGTFNNGLWELSPDMSKARQVNPLHFNNKIYFLDMIPDYSGRLWIATTRGLEIIDKTGNSIWKYPFSCSHAKFINQRPDTIMLCIDNKLLRFIANADPVFLDSNLKITARAFLEIGKHYWVGNQFGIYRYVKTKDFDIYKDFGLGKKKLKAIPVYGLAFHNGLIWAATGNGIQCYNTDGSEHGLPDCFRALQNDVIYSVIPDVRGRIWFTGNNGIGCITASENRVIFFNPQNNLQSLEFNYNAALQTRDGHLYFGGINGLNHIDPAAFNPDKEAPAVELISLYVSDTAFSPCIPPAIPDIKLSRLAPHISGKVFSNDYLNAGSLLYSFYLEGYQEEWSKPSNSADFTYRNLPPGKYRLLVKCADTYMNWSVPAQLLFFTISPAFYKTWWFMILLTISIIGITILAVKKVQLLRYQNRLREIEWEFAIEKERLRISKDMHDEVGASLTRISILSELAKKQQNEPAKAEHIIEQISEISSDVVDEMSEIIWAMNPRNDKLDSFTSYIRQHASSYLESAEINGTFTFPDEIPSYPMSSELRRNLFLTVKEAFHNIVKHSGAGNVHMSLDIEKLRLKIIIEDDGAGFNHTKINGWGIGLTNMHKRIEELGGSFKINSEVGKGTSIEFSVKLQEKDFHIKG